jgi:hypothetical protein
MDETAKPAENLKRKHDHERTDAKAKPVVAFAAGMAGLVVFGLVISLITFRFFVKRQPLGPPASPFENVRTLPPEPRLQVNAPQDLERYKAEQTKMLDSYGWVDQKAGIVRIPVERAMDILLQQGFPVRSNSPETSGTLQASTSESSRTTASGQTLQTGPGSGSTGLRRQE